MTCGRLPEAGQAKRVIELAIAEARAKNHNYVGTEHLLLGLLLEPDGVAGQVLRSLGYDARNYSGSWHEWSRTDLPLSVTD